MAPTRTTVCAAAMQAMRRVVEEAMSDKIYDVPADWQKRAFVDEASYQQMYQRSIADPTAFWEDQAKRIHWYRTPTKIKNTTYSGNVSIKWY
jgi:acetyl-CoA synthetase